MPKPSHPQSPLHPRSATTSISKPSGSKTTLLKQPEAKPTPSALNLLATPTPAPLVPVNPPAASPQLTTLVEASQLPAPVQSRKLRRNGRIASLPKLERDMVNHMLWNSVPYKNIVAALDEAGYTVTERNVSNWARGGYIEWSLAQEHILQNRLDQDHLLDFLRRDDATELPEVGLQAAATRLSQVLLQKLAHADDPEAHLENFSKLVDLLCRLNREIANTQKNRDASRRTLGPEYDPARVKEEEQLSTIELERHFSDPPADSTLPKPRVAPALPPIPTASLMAQQAREEREEAQIDHMKHMTQLIKRITGTMSGAQTPPPLTTQASSNGPQHNPAPHEAASKKHQSR